MKISRIFVDLDDVLADFFSAACLAHGLQPSEYRGNPELWGMLDGLSNHYNEPISLNEFWQPIIKQGEAFWTSLEPLPHALELLRWIALTGAEWYVLTSPGPHLESYTGKIKWLQRYFGMEFGQFILTENKHLLANPKSCLIDDREEAIRNFELAGGYGIIFPTRGNNLHTFKADPISYVVSRWEEFKI